MFRKLFIGLFILASCSIFGQVNTITTTVPSQPVVGASGVISPLYTYNDKIIHFLFHTIHATLNSDEYVAIDRLDTLMQFVYDNDMTFYLPSEMRPALFEFVYWWWALFLIPLTIKLLRRRKNRLRNHI